ncbi:SNF2-related protein [Nocardioides sp. zg-DK7169]|uniref:DEAD/DEAH box helicase n=1 Tax=Nocardioides sp. zg-DK7169 TaxID=2736600 RepID=UPI003463D19A
MSFVPVTGPAEFRAGEPPREGVVVFTGDDGRGRSVELPMRAALPVLTRAHQREDLHPSVGLLAGAVLLGMRLVAAGRFEPADTVPPSWRPAPLDEADRARVELLARARAHDGLDEETAAEVVRQVVAAVVDAMPRSAPESPARTRIAPPRRTSGRAPSRTPRRAAVPVPAPPSGGDEPLPPGEDLPVEDFRARLQARIARHRTPAPDRELAQLVTLSLRVEADEEELVGGSVRLVLQVQDERDPLHVCDAALLWLESGAEHGFGDRARTHAMIALRAAAEAWPVLDRFLSLRVPDEITLDADEITSLLEDGVAALRGRGIDVLWPRSLGRDLTTRAVLDRAAPAGRARDAEKQEDLLNDGLFGKDDAFTFSWQVALHGDPLTEEEMDELARAATPILKLRGSWTVVDPSVARRARRRLLRRASAGEAIAAALTGVVQLPATDDEVEEASVIVGASIVGLSERLRGATRRDPVAPPAGLHATLRDYQLQGLTWLAELTSLGVGACLADDMGLGKTITLIALHLHRAEQRAEQELPAGEGQPGAAGGPTLVVCPASLLGNWEAEIHRFAPGVPVRRFHGGARTLEGLTGGFVLTTYGTMRTSAAELGAVPWDLVVADEAQHIKNARTSTARALRTIGSTARVALTGTPVENDLTELWSILDWTTPGLLGSRLAFRRAWAAGIESGTDPAKARRFAELIEPFLLRRRKSDPGIAPELPAKTETDHPLSLTREQVVLYEAFVRDTLERVERAEDEATRRGLVLMLLTGLKQICNHPAHFLKQSGAVRLAGRSEKLDLLDELVETVVAEDGAVLVFTQYVAMARLLEAHLSRTGVAHQLLHGGTPVREREAMVARFQAGEVPVFLLSLKAGGTGLNLTRADHVVHLDRWWNPAVEDQATDRAYRIGQTKPVQVHRLVTVGTIEERIGELLARKKSLADSVLGNGEAALTELSDAELRDFVTLRRDP